VKKDDPVATARLGVQEAQAALHRHDEKKDALNEKAARLTRQLDQATLQGDTQASERCAEGAGTTEKLLASLERVRRQLVAALADADTKLKQAEAAKAQAEIDALGQEMETLNGEITKTLEQVAALIEQHARFHAQASEAAGAHGLPSPPKHRWLLPRELIRSKGAEALRAALDLQHAVGMQAASAL